MDTQIIDRQYIHLLRKFGIDFSVEIQDGPRFPAQEIIQRKDGFTVRLNPSKFIPGLGYESYVAYNARCVLLPRLVLETEHLKLRRLKMTDAEDCFAFLSDQKGMHLDCCKPFTCMDDAYRQRIALFAERETQYAIQLKATGSVIGTVNVFRDDSRAVEAMEIGYAIAPAHQRKGYAFEILSALVKLLQQELRLDMIVAGVLPENIPSVGLLKKLGFCEEGLRHKAIWHEGLDKPVDLLYYYLDRT